MREAEKKRLVKLIEEAHKKSAEAIHEHIMDTLKTKGRFNSKTDADRQSIYEIEADYLLDNGVIVPPCKIDDKVYIIEHPSSSLPLSDVVEGYVISMHWHDYGNHMQVLFDTKRIFGCFDYNVDREFNKTVFLSKAEAEYALKNRRSVSLVNGHIEE